MSHASPLVSVILPVRNGAAFINAAVDSVLAQDYPNLEVLVVENGSTDDTRERLRKYAEAATVTCFFTEPRKISATRNFALERAAGDFIAFIDADDLWLPGKMRRQVEYLRNHPESDIVFTRYRNILEYERLRALAAVRRELLGEKTGYFYLMTAMARRGVFEKCGPFDVGIDVGEDSEVVFRMRRMGVDVSHRLEDVLYLRRLHGANSVLTTDNFSQKIAASLALNLRQALMKKSATRD